MTSTVRWYNNVETVVVAVQMTLPVGQSPSSQVVGRYIGSQGPLPNTVTDFWQMVWEQRVHLMLMLTAESEGRRAKCHRYWPQYGETAISHGHLTVSCSSEQKTSAATVRNFQLTHNAVSYTDVLYFVYKPANKINICVKTVLFCRVYEILL